MLYMFRFLALTGLLTVMTSSCSTPISTYQEAKPELVIEDFFDGQLSAHGIVKDYKGKVIRHFSADITAYWKNGVGTLDEDFVFDDGEKQKRVWTITPKNGADSSNKETAFYEGHAGDVIGVAPVSVVGNAMFLKYKLEIPYKDSTMVLTVDDRMYLVDDRVIINESKLYKFGLPVGRITLTIVKN